MKKQGYVIGQTKSANKFFTTSSAYDRPQWVGLTEASVFQSADLAQQAAKKLWKYGSYSANLVSLAELYDDTEGELDPIDSELDPIEGEPTAYGADGELEGDAIAAMDDPELDGEQEGPCPECDEEPCVCPDDESAYGADGELDGDAIPAMSGDSDVDLDSADGDVSMSFEMPDDENDENAISPEEIAMVKKVVLA